MIEDIRPTEDGDVAIAKGERYDIRKVLAAMGGILDAYAAFAEERGLEAPYTLSTPKPPRPGDDGITRLLKSSGLAYKLPYGAHTMRIIGALVETERAEYDAGGFRHHVEAPPFRFDLYPLGTDPLYANFGLCREAGVDGRWVTVEGLPGTDYDQAPVVRVSRHMPPLPEGAAVPRPDDQMLLQRPHRKLLTEFLETRLPEGVAFERGRGGLVEEPVRLRFPHAVFGAGIGDIRVAVLRAGGD